MDYVQESEAPKIYQQWCAVSMIASCLQRKVWLPWGEYYYPNMFILLVGSSGVRKGTALSPARALLRALPQEEVVFAASSTTREALIGRMHKVQLPYPDPRRDLEEGEEAFHRSITVFSPEFSVFINRNTTELTQNLADWYDCPDLWDYETKGRGVESVSYMFVNLLGATTPDLITKHLPQEIIGGGLASRMIMVFADVREKDVIFPPNPEDTKEERQKLLYNLHHILRMTGEFTVTQGFKDFYKEWREDDSINPTFSDRHFEAYMTRRPSHLLKLSMIMSASRNDELVIQKQDIERADVFLRPGRGHA